MRRTLRNNPGTVLLFFSTDRLNTGFVFRFQVSFFGRRDADLGFRSPNITVRIATRVLSAPVGFFFSDVRHDVVLASVLRILQIG